ncbi:asparagine synthetase [Candidatus Micrarchaeota archaeon]|nr:asparagine synthetase [Candidatus Micrarchaeota archaeon]
MNGLTRVEIARITDKVLDHAQRYFRSEGFLEIKPVMLACITDPLDGDPGSAVLKTGTIEYGGQNLSLMQSMILHKQKLIAEGFEKIFIMSPNIRLEQPHREKTGRHAFEFMQVDFEIAHGKKEDVFRIVEGFMVSLSEEFQSLKERGKIEMPFERHLVKDLEAEYGPDWETIMSRKSRHPFWALGLEREFYDDEKNNYDLILPEGYGEVLSGGQRIHETEAVLERMKSHGILEKNMEYVEFARQGIVPSAGGGIGVDRLVRYIAEAEHVGDVQLFPRIPGRPVTF